MTPEEDAELTKRITAIVQRDYEGYKQEETQRLQFQHDFAQSALKSGVIVNGGAIVALFTFLGHDKAAISPEWLWWSFACFSVALGCALLAHLGAFLSQGFYMNSVAYNAIASRAAIGQLVTAEDYEAKSEAYTGWGHWALGLALLTSVGSLAGFLVGAGCALAGLSG